MKEDDLREEIASLRNLINDVIKVFDDGKLYLLKDWLEKKYNSIPTH